MSTFGWLIMASRSPTPSLRCGGGCRPSAAQGGVPRGYVGQQSRLEAVDPPYGRRSKNIVYDHCWCARSSGRRLLMTAFQSELLFGSKVSIVELNKKVNVAAFPRAVSNSSEGSGYLYHTFQALGSGQKRDLPLAR